MFIALSESCFNKTEGLMGNNNGNKSDDLRPFNSSDLLDSSSFPEDIYDKTRAFLVRQ